MSSLPLEAAFFYNTGEKRKEEVVTSDGPAGIMDMHLSVSEVFFSIQGESTWAGMPCAFIRLAGCNLRCQWCDTEYAQSGGEPRSIAALLDMVDHFGADLIEITGGEPLLQDACPALAQALLDNGYTVLVETNGSMPIDTLPENAIRIMDLKCPASGMSDRIHWPNLERLHPDRDEVKLVMASREDYEWGRAVVRRESLPERCRAVLFSPVAGKLPPRRLAEWILEDRLPVRFQLQLHKAVWPADLRGV